LNVRFRKSLIFLLSGFVALLGASVPARVAHADDPATSRANFYNLPITDSSSPTFLNALNQDMTFLQSKGAVFAPVSSTSKPYSQAGFEIDFANSKLSGSNRLLALQWQKARNYFALKGQLENCGIKGDNRDLVNRLENSAANVKIGDMNCQTLMEATSPQIENLANINKSFVSSQLEDIVLKKALAGAGKSYGYAQARFPSPSKISLCGAWQYCDEDAFETMSAAIKQGGAGVSSITTPQLRDELNNSINTMNSKLGVTQTPNVGDWKKQLPDPALQEYTAYASVYGQALSQPDGGIFLTEPVLKKTGALRTFANNGGSHGGIITMPAHGAVDDQSVNAGIGEYRSTLIEEMGMLNTLYYQKKRVEGHDPQKPSYRSDTENRADLKRLLINNPAAVGQALMEFPEGAKALCSMISEIQQDDVTKQRHDRYFKIGAGVVAAGLLATGVLSWAGVGILAAEGAGTVILAASVTAGIVTTSAELDRAATEQSQYHELEASVLAHTGDEKTRQEAMKALSDYTSDYRMALVDGVLTAADLGALGKLATSGKTVSEIKTMRQLASDAEAAAKSGDKVAGVVANIESAAGDADMVKAIDVLEQGSNQTLRAKALAKLNLLKGDNLKNALKKLLKLSENCT
jgi:hypothetical protein